MVDPEAHRSIISDITAATSNINRKIRKVDLSLHLNNCTQSISTSSTSYHTCLPTSTMPHSKTPGQSNAASDKYNKQEAEGTIQALALPEAQSFTAFQQPFGFGTDIQLQPRVSAHQTHPPQRNCRSLAKPQSQAIAETRMSV
jgi:hypothetical protein